MTNPADSSSPDDRNPLPRKNGNEEAGDPGLVVEVARQIEHICDQLEAAWMAERATPPDLKTFLNMGENLGFSPSESRELLRQLLLMDLAYRKQRGLSDTIVLDEYFDQFPDCPGVVTQAFQDSGFHVSTIYASPFGHEETSQPLAETAFERPWPGAPHGEESDFLSMPPSEIPQQLDKYQIQKKLGGGGMGVVYLAWDTEMERAVAIKVMKPGHNESEESTARFRREIRLVAQLKHPNTVMAYHSHEDPQSKTHYLVMEYLEGVDLEKLAKHQGKFSIADACELIRQAALGLAHAHEHGLIHRDVKPANFLLCAEGIIKVLDLGLARSETAQKPEDRMSLTNEGQFLGTPHYASPEQILGNTDITTRTDLYSLGCTFYKLLTGETPFGTSKGSTAQEVLMQHIYQDFPAIKEQRPDVPSGLVRIFTRMVAKAPEDRIDSAAAVAEMLEPFCKGHDVQQLFRTYEVGEIVISRPPAKRRWLLDILAGALLVALVIFVLWYFVPRATTPVPAVDVFAKIDLNRDPMHGPWEKTKTALISPVDTPRAWIRLPMMLPEEFQLEITAKRFEGVGLMFIHRHPQTPFALEFTLQARTQDQTSQRKPSAKELSPVISKSWAIQNAGPQTLVFSVRGNQLTITRDGTPLAERAEYPQLPAEFSDIPDRPGFYIVTENSEYEFTEIRLTPLKSDE